MGSVATEANNAGYAQSSEAREAEKKPERGWRLGREPWSPEYERRVSMEVVTSGSMIEAAGGFAAIILAILSFATVVPVYLVPVATIVLGVALLFEGGAVATRYWRLPLEIATGRWASTELAIGMFAEFLAGVSGVVLGILALLGFAPIALLSAAVLVFGVALLLGSGLTSRLNHLEYEGREESRQTERFSWPARFVSRVATGFQFLIGLGAMLLAILALVGIASTVLIMTSVLIVGLAAFLSGTAISSRIMHLLHRC